MDHVSNIWTYCVTFRTINCWGADIINAAYPIRSLADAEEYVRRGPEPTSPAAPHTPQAPRKEPANHGRP